LLGLQRFIQRRFFAVQRTETVDLVLVLLPHLLLILSRRSFVFWRKLDLDRDQSIVADFRLSLLVNALTYHALIQHHLGQLNAVMKLIKSNDSVSGGKT